MRVPDDVGDLIVVACVHLGHERLVHALDRDNKLGAHRDELLARQAIERAPLVHRMHGGQREREEGRLLTRQWKVEQPAQGEAFRRPHVPQQEHSHLRVEHLVLPRVGHPNH